MRLSIIDADSIAYIVGHRHSSTSLNNPNAVIAEVDKYVENILHATKATHYSGFIGGEGLTFRHQATVVGSFGGATKVKLYKGNRGVKGMIPSRPWEAVINSHLVHHWGFHPVPSWIEADDAVSILAHDARGMAGIDYTICGIDKDLLQIPGTHFNYNKYKTTEVTEKDAAYSICKQMLMGDTVDTIAGVEGIGPKKAESILSKANSVGEQRYLVLAEYVKKYGIRLGTLKHAEQANLLMMLTSRDELPEDVRQAFTTAEVAVPTHVLLNV